MRLVVGDASWAADTPQWILDAVADERMTQGFIELLRPGTLPETVGDAEVLAYLMPASMRAPMHSYYVEIYTWLVARLCKAHGKTILDFMQEKLDKGLTRDEERELDELRRDLWRLRGGKVRSELFDALRDLKKQADRQPVDEWATTESLFGGLDEAA